MKKIIFLLLLIFSTYIFAEWTIQGGNDDTTLYIDFQSMRKEGQIIDLWNMIDNKTIQVNGDYKYLSEKNHFEYDCEKETLRILDGSFYADHIGKGDTVFEQLNLKEKPEKITTGTMTEVLWKIACDKK
jgi:hypothetical protein